MADTRITRRRPSAPVLFRAPFFSAPGFSSLAQALDEMTSPNNDLLQTAFTGFPEFSIRDQFPVLNASESKTEFTVTAELPGMSAKDVNIDYCDGVLTIKGEKVHEETKKEDDLKFYMWERRFGSFQRALPFPGGIADSKITAEFKDGILTVHLPKAEEDKITSRKIEITQA
jgi:HSP20 family protein